MKPLFLRSSKEALVKKIQQYHLLGNDEKKYWAYRHHLCPVSILEEAFLKNKNRKDKEGIISAIVLNPSLPWSLAVKILETNQKPYIVKNLNRHINNPGFQKTVTDDLSSFCLDFFNAFIPAISIKEFKENSFISGNSIRHFINKHGDDNQTPPLNDIDFFFTNKDYAEKLLSSILGNIPFDEDTSLKVVKNDKGLSIEGLPKRSLLKATSNYYPGYSFTITENALTIEHLGSIRNVRTPKKFQLIYRYIDSAEKVTGDFDFAHCTGIYDFKELKISSVCADSIYRHYLVYQGGSNPIESMVRSIKFCSQGMRIEKSDLLKIALHSQTFNVKDPEVLNNQLKAYYGGKDRYPETQVLGTEELSEEELTNLLDYLSSKHLF